MGINGRKLASDGSLGAASAAEWHPQFFAVVEEVFFRAALRTEAVRHLLIRAINVPGMGAFRGFNGCAQDLLVGRLGATWGLDSSLDHVIRLVIQRA
jgi:hypothetical protein